MNIVEKTEKAIDQRLSDGSIFNRDRLATDVGLPSGQRLGRYLRKSGTTYKQIRERGITKKVAELYRFGVKTRGQVSKSMGLRLDLVVRVIKKTTGLTMDKYKESLKIDL